MNIFSERLTIALKQQKMSQRELARRIGVTQPTIWIWINREYPPVERLIEICDTLKISPNYLLGFDDEEI